MPRGIPTAGHRKPGGGRKSSPLPKKNYTLYLTEAEHTALRKHLETLRRKQEAATLLLQANIESRIL